MGIYYGLPILKFNGKQKVQIDWKKVLVKLYRLSYISGARSPILVHWIVNQGTTFSN